MDTFPAARILTLECRKSDEDGVVSFRNVVLSAVAVCAIVPQAAP